MLHALAQLHLAGEDAAHVDFHILPAHQLRRRAAAASSRRSKRAGSARRTPCSISALRLAQLVGTLQLGQLQRAVHASHLHAHR